MSQPFARRFKEADHSWGAPPDHRAVSTFSFDEYIQPSFLNPEESVEGYVSDDARADLRGAHGATPPCSKDTCGEDPCTAFEHCTDTTCNVAPCNDQECNQYCDECEPCIGDCNGIHEGPCCDDGKCLEEWPLDSLCFEPHLQDSLCTQPCFENDQSWEYQLCPDFQQLINCGARNGQNQPESPKSDELGMLVLSDAVTRSDPSTNTFAVAQSLIAPENHGIHSCHTWAHAQIPMPLQQSFFPGCSVHNSEIYPPFPESASNVTQSYKPRRIARDVSHARHASGRAYPRPGGNHTANKPTEQQNKRRRLSACCAPDTHRTTHMRSSTTGSIARRTTCSGAAPHCHHRSIEHSGQQMASHHHRTSSSHLQSYMPTNSTQDWNQPSIPTRRAMCCQSESHLQCHGHPPRPAPINQYTGIPFTHHTRHSCGQPCMHVAPQSHSISDTNSISHWSCDFSSASVPPSPGLQSTVTSPGYTYTPNMGIGNNFMRFATSTAQVKVESPAVLNAPTPPLTASTFPDTVEVMIDMSESETTADHATGRKATMDFKREPMLQPGRPKEATDTCKWVLNPDATFGEWITCNTKFDDPQKLTAHFEMHIEEDMKKRSTGDKKFYCRQLGCDRCNNSPFQQKGKLVRHVKSHSKGKAA